MFTTVVDHTSKKFSVQSTSPALINGGCCSMIMGKSRWRALQNLWGVAARHKMDENHCSQELDRVKKKIVDGRKHFHQYFQRVSNEVTVRSYSDTATIGWLLWITWQLRSNRHFTEASLTVSFMWQLGKLCAWSCAVTKPVIGHYKPGGL